MPTFRAGNIEIELSDPYPIWIVLRAVNGPAQEVRISHHDLDDLHYVIERARRRAKYMIGAPKANESGP